MQPQSPLNRYVIVRNITSRNWASGFQIRGSSRVALEGVKADSNVNYGIEVSDSARVAITGAQIHGTGFRLNPATGDFPSPNFIPNPGKGIEFDDSSSGSILFSTITGSFRAGISSTTNSRGSVCIANVNVFDNTPNFEGSLTGGTSCSQSQRGNSSTPQKQGKQKAKPRRKTERLFGD